MNKTTLSALLLLLVFLLPLAATATPGPDGKNKKCPVTGEKVDPKVTYTYKDKTYAFCCPGCVEKFKKEPEKFIANSAKGTFDACEDEGEAVKSKKAKAVINTGKDMSSQISNTTCPVMKEPVDKTVTTVSYNGKVYGFCCKACIKKFAANPEKYLKKK